MERSAKSLRQHRAVLAARQGDPESPASGTCYAHRQRLAAELTRSLAEFGLAVVDQPALAKGLSTGRVIPTRHSRSPAAIEEDLRIVDGEIASLQTRIDEIDRLLAGSERHANY
ncbi:MAG: hypothetical protein HY000_38235 [Planctomycetes bacterium]|nr:hypothetical protein [Planctomycetota bacterium]